MERMPVSGLDAIGEGYYAVLDPADIGRMSYWRRVCTPKTNGLKPWPAKAWYGPVTPRRRDVPTDRLERDKFVTAWFEARRTYLNQVVAAIGAHPEAAAVCFARFGIRCWSCGRALTDETSKTLGIGPECRADLDPAVLARYCTPEVARIHAEHLAAIEEASR